MKTKRRHELQTNQLADTLGRLIEQVKPYSSWIGLGVLAICVIGGVVYYIDTQNSADQGAAWTEFFNAHFQQDAEQLREVAERHEGTEAALWASQSMGDLELSTGISTLYTDRVDSEGALNRAKRAFQDVEKSAPPRSMIMQRALFGLAQVHETLGDLDEAKTYYEKVVSQWPDSMVGNEATERIKAIQEPATREWYAWLAKYEPPAQDPQFDSSFLNGLGKDLLGGDLPDTPTSPFSTLDEGPAPLPGAAPDDDDSSDNDSSDDDSSDDDSSDDDSSDNDSNDNAASESPAAPAEGDASPGNEPDVAPANPGDQPAPPAGGDQPAPTGDASTDDAPRPGADDSAP